MDRSTEEHPPQDKAFRLSIDSVLADLGLAQDDAAAEGLRRLAAYLVLHPGSTPTLSELYSLAGNLPADTEKQIRLAIQTALGNLASHNIENPDGPVFISYADKLFRPWQLKLEARYLKDGIEPRGRPSVLYFVHGLASLCRAANTSGE